MKCKQYGTELLYKREDAIFCNENCKQKHYKRRKKVTEKVRKLEIEISRTKPAIKELLLKSDR